jgi:ParB family chromosome partitioning protein
VEVRTIVGVDPFRCRMWEWHDRLEHHIDESSCKAEIESFKKHGQLVPTLGRPLKGDPTYDVELIYGARRLFVARYLKRPLLVDLREVSETEAIVAMDIENRHRIDISPYERGLSYLRCLRAGYFKSQGDLSRALKISASQISRLLKLAQLPAVVVSAFRSPVDICETWALDLADALDDSKRRPQICARAREIASMTSKPQPRDIYSQLLTAGVSGRKVRRRARDEVVKGDDGKPLFRIRLNANTVAVLLPLETVSANRLAKVRTILATALQEIGAEDAEHRIGPPITSTPT